MPTLAQTKTWLSVTGTESDAVLQMALDQALAQCEKRMGRYLGPPREATEVLDGNGRDRLVLRVLPIADSVEVLTRPDAASAWSSLAGSFEVDNRSLYIKEGTWPAGRRNIKAVYQEGVPEDSPLQEVEGVILCLVARSFRGRGSENLEKEKLGDVEFTYRQASAQDDPLSILPRKAGFA